jgi:polyhydroxyalkanoate synthesis repressor PhaR
MTEPRTIKRHSNRRLYDTNANRYVTLAGIRKLVIEGCDFNVIERSTKEDVAHSILMQVLAVEETQNGPLLSREFLLEAIRSPQVASRTLVASFLEQSLHLLTAQYESRSASQRMKASFSRRAMSRLALANHQRWRWIQDEICRKLTDLAQGPAVSERVTAKARPRLGVGFGSLLLSTRISDPKSKRRLE